MILGPSRLMTVVVRKATLGKKSVCDGDVATDKVVDVGYFFLCIKHGLL